MANKSLEANCHCGRVTIELPRKPDYINDCNCTLCSTIDSWSWDQ